MTVIPFPSCRFTPADLTAFYEVALPKCSRGSWAGVARQTGRHHDRLLISLPGVRTRLRLRAGCRWSLSPWFRDGDGARCIGKGTTAVACLGIWKPAPVRRRSVAVPAG